MLIMAAAATVQCQIPHTV